jgi:hypothetical protein
MPKDVKRVALQEEIHVIAAARRTNKSQTNKAQAHSHTGTHISLSPDGIQIAVFGESDRERQSNIEMIIVELWTKCNRLENISSELRQISFRLLNSGMQTEPEHRNQALTQFQKLSG